LGIGGDEGVHCALGGVGPGGGSPAGLADDVIREVFETAVEASVSSFDKTTIMSHKKLLLRGKALQEAVPR
jgi:hypothetical protein